MSSAVVRSRYSGRGDFIAFVTVALDKQRISVERTDGAHTSSGNERYLYLEGPGVECTCLEWVEIGGAELVAVGQSNGEVQLYSPVANQMLHKLVTGDIYGVTDFQCDGIDAWCVTRKNVVYQFAMTDFSLVRELRWDDCGQLERVCVVDKNTLLLASHSIFLVSLLDKSVIRRYPGHLSAVSSLVMLGKEYFLSGADNDRFLNIYNLESGATKAVLVADSNIVEVSHSGDHVVAVTTEEGKVEIFADPLINSNHKRRGNLSKRPTKVVEMERDGTGKRINVINCKLSRDVLRITWLEKAVILYHKHLQWEALDSTHKIMQAAPTVKTAIHGTGKSYSDVAAAKSYAEGNATVTSGDNFKHIQDLIKDMERADIEDDSSLGETLQDKLAASAHSLSSKSSKKGLSTGTLTVVLAQALQSNDHSLLETVLNTRDEKVIEATIVKLKPALAVTLLERLAERVARQSHRQGLLNIWCKWCLIVHGGYLITIPNLISQLASLHSTLKNRSALLPRLQTLEASLNCCLNELDAKRAHCNSDPSAFPDVYNIEENEDESDVEYNEELDDNGLIDDGELDSEDGEDEEDAEATNNIKGNHSNPELNNHNEDVIKLASDEEGYSDVEMQ
ncbi:HFL166Cp [Eremothecium sinecaudum]|uniref:HFL166Cp n=1 Tax=Eremothecium sinecaudum TaxID=45286 RepID=A0A120K2J2_9SACH|nr:HFL166Cp [Eremothecium sinecaudum]AMD21690.1 HFL166Cp [Eremothecium sinecaudum]